METEFPLNLSLGHQFCPRDIIFVRPRSKMPSQGHREICSKALTIQSKGAVSSRAVPNLSQGLSQGQSLTKKKGSEKETFPPITPYREKAKSKKKCRRRSTRACVCVCTYTCVRTRARAREITPNRHSGPNRHPRRGCRSAHSPFPARLPPSEAISGSEIPVLRDGYFQNRSEGL